MNLANFETNKKSLSFCGWRGAFRAARTEIFAGKVPEQSEGEQKFTPSDIFLAGENGAVLREICLDRTHKTAGSFSQEARKTTDLLTSYNL
jgi:hypothetical protein